MTLCTRSVGCLLLAATVAATLLICCTPALADGLTGTLTGTVSSTATGKPVRGATVTAGTGATTATDGAGAYRLELPPGLQSVTVSEPGYLPQTLGGIEIVTGGSVTRDFTLSLNATAEVVEGTVRDGDGHGWPLYARLDVTGPGYSRTVFSDPVTGFYSLALTRGTAYTVNVSATGYAAATQGVTPQVGGTVADFSLAVDQSYCTAPGYPPRYSEPLEIKAGGFYTSKPAIWSCGTPPGAPGPHSGTTVCGSNMAYANRHLDWDAYLYSPVIDLSGYAGSAMTLSWWQQYRQHAFNEMAYVSVSKNGGSSWTNVYTADYLHPDDPGWVRISVTLDSSYAVNNFRLRFNHWGYSTHLSDSSWFIDDITVQLKDSCPPQAGGLVVGTVLAADGTTGVNGATVTDGGSRWSFTTATPADPVLPDGFFSLFLPAGGSTVSAAGAGAGAASQVTVPADGVVRQDFQLAPCSFTVTPGDATLPSVGGSGTVQVTTGPGCAWTASSGQSWLLLTAGGNGYGSGTVAYRADLNFDGVYRTAPLTIAGQTVTVNQEAGRGSLGGRVTSAATGAPLAGLLLRVNGLFSAQTDSAGYYQFDNLWAGPQTLTASAYGHAAASLTVTVVKDTVTVQDVALALDGTAAALVEGTVTDGSGHGWPLYARIDISGTGHSETVYTDPLTGRYAAVLAQGTPFTFSVVAAGYATASRGVTPAAGGSALDVALTADVAGCTAPGYRPFYEETFESGNGGYTASGTNASWAWGVPADGYRTAHGGSKAWATDLAGYYNYPEDSYLTSPAIDLSGNSGKWTSLSWWESLVSDNYTYSSVEASSDGGASWSVVYGPFTGSPYLSPWVQRSVTLPPSYAVGNFRFRLHLANTTSGVMSLGWLLDDVKLLPTDTCLLRPGGLLIGNVLDGASGSGLNGATVSAGGQTAVTAATPGDPLVADGLYTLFVPTGTTTASASATGYVGMALPVAVPADTVARQDFALAACSYTLLPASGNFSATAGSGSFQVVAAAGCPWTVTGAPAWLTITAGTSGSGTGTVSFTLAANTAAASRSATLTVAGQGYLVTQVGSYPLSVTVDPVGGGMVRSSGISCPGSCSTSFSGGSVVSLAAFTSPGYEFTGWNGCDSPAGDLCTMTMSAARSVTAQYTTCATAGVKGGGGTAYYQNLQQAIAAAQDGELQCQAVVFTESPVLDTTMAVSIRGGYDCGFSATARPTVIQGSLTILRGTITVDNLVII